MAREMARTFELNQALKRFIQMSEEVSSSLPVAVLYVVGELQDVSTAALQKCFELKDGSA